MRNGQELPSTSHDERRAYGLDLMPARYGPPAVHRDTRGVQDLWRTADGVTAWLDHFDPTRVIDAWVLSFGRMTVGTRLDGAPSPF